MRVAGSTRDNQTDAVLDKAVRLARQEAGNKRPTNLEEERSASSAAYSASSGRGGLSQPLESRKFQFVDVGSAGLVRLSEFSQRRVFRARPMMRKPGRSPAQNYFNQ